MSTIHVMHRTFDGWLLLIVVMCGFAFREGLAEEPGEESSPRVIKSVPDDRSYEGVRVMSSTTTVDLMERTTKDVEFSEKLLKVDGHDPEILNVIALDPSRLRIRGLSQGVTTMIVTGASNQRYAIEVFVGGDSRMLQSVLKRHFPDSAIKCLALANDSVLLTGYVTDNQTISNIMDVARVYSGNIINHIRVGGPQEVQLRVKILEVQRSKLRTFGIDFQALTQSAVIASSPGSIAPISGLIAPLGGAPSATMTPSTANPASLAAGFSGDNFAFSAFIQALKTEGLLKVMTEPVLVARSGEAARLEDGGEFPIPVPGGLGTVTIEFREFGVIQQMLPIVISPTRVKMQVTAEVSDKDTANSITLLGTTVPGITKRKVQTTVDMNFGDTMVVAGMISTRVNATFLKTPFLGEFPVIGPFFSKKTEQQSETELIILITPEYGSSMPASQIPPGGPGTNTTSPTDREMYGYGMIEVPRYTNDCGPECATKPQNGQYFDSLQPNTGMPGSPMITPSPSATPRQGGLISPSGMGAAPSTTPPPPPADPSVSRRSATGTSWPSKLRTAISSKSKDSSSSTNSSAIQPAGYRNQSKSGRSSENSSSENKFDEKEKE